MGSEPKLLFRFWSVLVFTKTRERQRPAFDFNTLCGRSLAWQLSSAFLVSCTRAECPTRSASFGKPSGRRIVPGNMMKSSLGSINKINKPIRILQYRNPSGTLTPCNCNTFRVLYERIKKEKSSPFWNPSESKGIIKIRPMAKYKYS